MSGVAATAPHFRSVSPSTYLPTHACPPSCVIYVQSHPPSFCIARINTPLPSYHLFVSAAGTPATAVPYCPQSVLLQVRISTSDQSPAMGVLDTFLSKGSQAGSAISGLMEEHHVLLARPRLGHMVPVVFQATASCSPKLQPSTTLRLLTPPLRSSG